MRPAVTAELRRPPAAGHALRARTAVLLVLAVAIPVLAVAWIAGVGFGRTETNRADARLQSEAQSASDVFVRTVRRAQSRATDLASSAELQQALATRDRAAVEKLVRPNEVVYVGDTRFVGTPTPGAVRRNANVLIDGAPLGAVEVYVPLDDALLGRLRTQAGVDSLDRLALVRGGRTIAGAPAGAGAAPVAKAAELSLGGTDYRTFAVQLVGSPAEVNLVTLTPKASIGGGIHRNYWWLILALALTLLTVGIVGYAIAPLIARRDRRAGTRDSAAVALVGDALASTHNPDKLLPVILHATMDATGARGGRVLQDGRITAQEGNVGGDGRPLTLVLGSDESAGETALQIWPEGRSFDGRTRSLAQSLAAQAAIALDNARLHTIVQRQAITDELTELANRRRFMETLETELRRAERFDEPLAVVFADLDDFKKINDRHGHQVGDRVLRAFAGVLRGRVRTIDVAARLGGEEFAVLLVETDLRGAEALAESLRAAVADLEVPAGRGEPIRLTASFGVASYPESQTADDLLAAADLALYRAKREGKNRVRSEPSPA
jgi:diguanylate cyclase (GGDEF)-like protein